MASTIRIGVFCCVLLCQFAYCVKSHRPANKHTGASSSPAGHQHHHHHHHHDRQQQPPPADESIEDVDEDKIDEILNDGTRHLVVFLYDGKSKCADCAAALAKLEEVDDEIESSQFIEVVKSDDRNVATNVGVVTFPALVYFRRRNPILYDGEFHNSEELLRWVRAHSEVATAHLSDDDFEDRTNSASPSEGRLDWFVMFYNSKDDDCNNHIAIWETVAHKLRGQINVGKVDIKQSDDVADRFKISSHGGECPFHRGKMYYYKETAKDVRSLVNFALYKYKEGRGHRVPDPPTMIEELYEEWKENLVDFTRENRENIFLGTTVVAVIVAFISGIWVIRQYTAGKRTKKED